MSDFPAIIQGLSFDKFCEVFNASPRKAREIYLARHGIAKSKKKSNKVANFKARREERVEALFETLKTSPDPEMSEEMLRSWLLTKRELLGAALDHLGIEHNEGLTQSDDVGKIESLGKKDLQALIDHVKSKVKGDDEDILLYLRFMGAKNIDKVAN